MILCYELSDKVSLTLYQVKAHDVRAFAASKAFQSGVSLEQILSACRGKSHNTFTQFYLKDMAWTVYKYIIKKKKNCDKLLLGGLFPLWDLTHPSLPLSQSRSVKRGGGGGNVGTPLGNRILVTDHGLLGFPDLNSTRASEFCCLFTSSP